MGVIADVLGRRFGKLVVVSKAGKNKHGKITWSCVCDCGGTNTPTGSSLLNGNTTTCGCGRREANLKHGQSQIGNKLNYLYSAQRNARQRCENPKDKDYEWYGGRGIKWAFATFEDFVSAIGERPDPAFTIDRIDVNRDYEAGNLRWVSRSAQSINQRLSVLNTSGYRGVSPSSDGRGRWVANIVSDGKQRYIGTYPTPEVAAEAYDENARRLHGEFAMLNFPSDLENGARC